VRCLERRAGGQRRPARLRVHRMPVCACDACPVSGLVLTAAEDTSACLWRSAGAMAARGEAALLARVESEGPSSYAWLLPPVHLARLRASPLYRLRCAAGERAAAAASETAPPALDAAAEAASADDAAEAAFVALSGSAASNGGVAASRAWRGASALVVLVSRLPDSAPQCASATLWEFPLPAPPPFASVPTDDDAERLAALPPPSRVAIWRDIFAGPPPPADAAEAEEDDRVGVIGPTLCKGSAMLAAIAADGGITLRDLCTGCELRPEALRDARALQLRNVVCDEHAGSGGRQMLLESRTQQMTVIDVEADAQVVRFQLPRQQLPIMYSDRVAAWLAPASRFLVTGEAVALPPYGKASNDANTLRVATRRDGPDCVCDAAAERAAAAAARDAPWLAPGQASVVLYRLWDCVRGRVAARIALPALRGEAEGGALAWNGNLVTLDALSPGCNAVSALLVAPEPAGARGRAAGALRLWRSDQGATLPLPDCAALQPREADAAQPPQHPALHALFAGMDPAEWGDAPGGFGHFFPPDLLAAALGAPPPPFQLGLTEAVSWRWAVIAEYAAGHNALHAPGSLTVLDFGAAQGGAAQAGRG